MPLVTLIMRLMVAARGIRLPESQCDTAISLTPTLSANALFDVLVTLRCSRRRMVRVPANNMFINIANILFVVNLNNLFMFGV